MFFVTFSLYPSLGKKVARSSVLRLVHPGGWLRPLAMGSLGRPFPCASALRFLWVIAAHPFAGRPFFFGKCGGPTSQGQNQNGTRTLLRMGRRDACARIGRQKKRGAVGGGRGKERFGRKGEGEGRRQRQRHPPPLPMREIATPLHLSLSLPRLPLSHPATGRASDTIGRVCPRGA